MHSNADGCALHVKVCLRMCYREFMSSFAACLGKIGHTMRGDSSGIGAGEQRNLIGQMGLIEIAELCRHSCGAARRRSFHVLQQRLEPHNSRQALWGKTYPIAQEAIQMAEADLAVAGELPYSYLSAAFFNSFECQLNTRVNFGRRTVAESGIFPVRRSPHQLSAFRQDFSPNENQPRAAVPLVVYGARQVCELVRR